MNKTAIAFLLGCLLSLNLSSIPAYGWLLLLALPVLLWFRQVVLSVFIVGLLWAGFQAQIRLEQRLTEQMAGQDILSQGSIVGIPEQYGDVVRFNFKPDDKRLPDKIRLSWYHHAGDIPGPGEEWQFMLRLKPPHGMQNPGGFDYEKWLFSQGLGATGYIRQSPDNQRLSVAPGWHIDKLRLYVYQQLSSLLTDARQLPLIIGLSVGIRDDLNPEHWQILRQTGTSHLLAISGLHIGLASAVGFFLFRWLWSLSLTGLTLLAARQAGALGGLLFALGYALLAGMAVPTQRALIMVTTVMLALSLRRPVYATHILSFSLLLILSWDPFSVLSAGFWLSFSAVALIPLTCSARFPARRDNWLWIHLWLAVGLVPLLVLFFGQVSLLSPLANLIAVPLVSLLIVPLILIGLLCLPISQTFASSLFHLADRLLDFLWQGLSWLAASPVSSWSLPELPVPLILITAFLLLVLLLPRGMPGRWLGLLALLPLVFYQPSRPTQGHAFFTLLDVDQGLSAILETSSHNLVFDTGPRYSSRFNTGTAVIAPYLQSRGINQVDAVVVSHSDNDHIGGVEGLKQHIQIDKIISSDQQALPTSTPCQAGQNWNWDGVEFVFLQPVADQQGSDNNRSCVLRVQAENMSILLTGDIEKNSERQLIKVYGETLKSDILVVPHHGSRTSSTSAFIKHVKPSFSLFPVGYRNRFGFPKPDVIARYQEAGSVILRTDTSGALLFSDHSSVTRWRQHAAKLWTAETTE